MPDLEGLAGLRFEIKQKKAFEIIEGSSIYENKQFSSENCYKMLWMLPKFSFGGIFVPELIRRGLVKKQKRKLQNLQPYDLKRIYRSYPIQIRLEQMKTR